MQCDEVCCSEMQFVMQPCCSLICCVTVYCIVLHYVAVCCSVLQCDVLLCIPNGMPAARGPESARGNIHGVQDTVLQCVAVCCNGLKSCDVKSCSILQCDALCCKCPGNFTRREYVAE